MAAMKSWIVWIIPFVMLPVAGQTCDLRSRAMCEKQFATLVAYRSEAIDFAFGNLSAAMPLHIAIKLIGYDDPEYSSLGRAIAYDPQRHSLLVPRPRLKEKMPNPLRAAGSYWPFYESLLLRKDYPIVEAIDDALWSAFLQEAARSRGVSWPHKECDSVETGKRLPCEMLRDGVAGQVKQRHTRLFNTNRLDRIWPDDFVAFQKRVWRDDLEYAEVQRYGGIALVQPLIAEFGVPRALAYIAQTPFVIDDGNMRASAFRYQQLARQAIIATAVTQTNNAGAESARDLKADNVDIGHAP